MRGEVLKMYDLEKSTYFGRVREDMKQMKHGSVGPWGHRNLSSKQKKILEVGEEGTGFFSVSSTGFISRNTNAFQYQLLKKLVR